jgi:hypothetical protein
MTWARVGGEWSASRLGRFTTGERSHGTHWIGGWLGSRAGLDPTGSLNQGYVIYIFLLYLMALSVAVAIAVT